MTTGWTDATSLLLELLDPTGVVLAHQSITLQTPADSELQTAAIDEGFHAFRLTASNTPNSNQNPEYTLSVTYTAPQTLYGRLAPGDQQNLLKNESFAFPSLVIPRAELAQVLSEDEGRTTSARRETPDHIMLEQCPLCRRF